MVQENKEHCLGKYKEERLFIAKIDVWKGGVGRSEKSINVSGTKLH